MADITIPREELEELTVYKEVNYQARLIAWARATAWAEHYYGKGYENTSRPERWPDWLLLKLLQSCMISAANPGYFAQPGEIDVNGTLVEAGGPRFSQADIGLSGPGSLLGQVALELTRRLKEAMREDELAEATARWTPPEAPS